MSDRIEQIRRAHKSAKPNPAANPAWFHAENDIDVLLAEIDRLRDSELGASAGGICEQCRRTSHNLSRPR